MNTKPRVEHEPWKEVPDIDQIYRSRETVTQVTTCPTCGAKFTNGVCPAGTCKPTDDMRGGPNTLREGVNDGD